MQVELNELPRVLNELFDNTELLRSMKRKAYQLGRPNAALAVIAELEHIVQKNYYTQSFSHDSNSQKTISQKTDAPESEPVNVGEL